MALPVCLVNRHNQLTALSALGLVPEKPVFPVVLTCPLCSAETLYLFDDPVTAGLWFYCETCRAHGDIITFGAQVWNTTPLEALDRFSDIGVTNTRKIDRLSGEYVRAFDRLRAGEEFWETAASQIWNHHDSIIACRLRELGVDESTDAGRGLLGVAHPDQITAFCQELGKAAPLRLRENGPSIVLPFYDLPGRMSGILLIQYNDRFMSRRMFLPLTGFKKLCPDAGYCMLHTVLARVPEVLRNSHFITDDLQWAIHAHCINARGGVPLLPILISYTGPEARSAGLTLPALGSAPRFFHSAQITPDTVTQAANAKGYVCAVPPLRARKPPHPQRTLGRLATFRGAARTWQTALHDAVVGTNEIAAQSFISKLNIDLDRLQTFLHCQSTLPKDVVGRLLARVEQRPLLAAKFQRAWSIIVRDGGWWSPAGAQVANAQIFVDKIVHGNADQRLYIGRILINGQTIPFKDTAARIESMGLLAYAAHVAATENQLLLYSARWNCHSHLAALRVQAPELVHVSSRNGWDPKTEEFGFYKYLLANDGQVRPVLYPEINAQKTADFPEPGATPPLTIHALLTPSYENAHVWTIFAALVADVLAPVLDKTPHMTAVPDDNFTAAAAVGRALGCQLRQFRGNARAEAVRALQLLASETDWPAFAGHAFASQRLIKTALALPAGHLFVQLPPEIGLITPSYGWQYAPGALTATPAGLEALAYVLPSYVQRALQTRMAFTARDPNLTRAVLLDLADWLKDIYGGTFSLEYALNQLITPDAAHHALMMLVNLGFEAGKIDILPHPRTKKQSRMFVMRNKHSWWLNQRAVDSYCVALGGYAPNWSALIPLFERDKLLLAEETVHNMPGLRLRKDWCDQFWSGLRKRELG